LCRCARVFEGAAVLDTKNRRERASPTPGHDEKPEKRKETFFSPLRSSTQHQHKFKPKQPLDTNAVSALGADPFRQVDHRKKSPLRLGRGERAKERTRPIDSRGNPVERSGPAITLPSLLRLPIETKQEHPKVGGMNTTTYRYIRIEINQFIPEKAKTQQQ